MIIIDTIQKRKKAYQAKIDFQESELNLYKNLASLGMLTGSFGHETKVTLLAEYKRVCFLLTFIWIMVWI